MIVSNLENVERKEELLTSIERINTTTLRKLVGADDTSKDGKQTAGQPPAKRVTEEVNLLSGIILGPEADTTEQERPLDWHTGVRMAAGQSVVVVKHGALELKVLLQEGHRLWLASLLDCAWASLWQTRDFLDEPDVAGLLDSLVSVNLGLLVSPVGQRSRVGPHGDLCGEMDQLEVRGHGLEVLTRLAVFNSDLEQGVVEAIAVGSFAIDSGELLVGGVVWRCDIVTEQP